MKSRIYVVDKGGGEISLVEATSKVTARNHVARDSIAVKYATQQDLVTCLAAGLKVQKAAPDESETA